MERTISHLLLLAELLGVPVKVLAEEGNALAFLQGLHLEDLVPCDAAREPVHTSCLFIVYRIEEGTRSES
jgi:hypothetical protein